MKDIRFIKLGFDEKKSKVARMDRKRIAERLEQIKFPHIGSIQLTPMTLNNVKLEAKRIASILYKGVGLKVKIFQNETKHPNENVLNEIKRLNKLFSLGQVNLDKATQKILSKYEMNSKNGKVFDVPVEPLEEMNSMQGENLKGPIFIFGDAEKMAIKTPVYMEAIYLGDKYDQLSIGTYIHEITHSLIDRHKGVIENYYNDEFLPVFMEKVAIDSVDTSIDKYLLKCSEVYRLANIKESLGKLETYKENSDEYKKCLQYIQGPLYAGILFDRYSKANDIKKQRMLEKVKSILNGKSKLNDFIEEEQLFIDGDEVFRYIDKVEGYVVELDQRRPTNLEFEASEMSSEEIQIKAIREGDKIAADIIAGDKSQKKDK